MKHALVSVTLVITVLLTGSRSAYAVSWCVAHEFAHAVDRAEVIFSGKIIKIERVQIATRALPESQHKVTFKVETWWKGTPASEIRVLWRSSSTFDCPFFPVGEIGEDYLVYADPAKYDSSPRENLPEVSVLSRTSKLPPNPQPKTFTLDGWKEQKRLNPYPPLNRSDASHDIELLGLLRDCSCSVDSPLPAPLSNFLERLEQPKLQETNGSACKACLRSRLKPFQ